MRSTPRITLFHYKFSTGSTVVRKAWMALGYVYELSRKELAPNSCAAGDLDRRARVV